MENEPIKISEPSSCPKCGEKFHCSTSNKCWCYEVDVPADLMEKLQEEYDGCLCPDCLKEYAFYPLSGLEPLNG